MNHKSVVFAVLVLLFVYKSNAQEQKEIKLEPFNNVKFEGSAQWVLVPSSEEKVVILSKSEDVFDYIDVNQNGGTLVVSTTDKNKNITKLFKSVTIKVYFKSIESVFLSGVGSVNTEDKIVTSKFTATLKGTGDMNLDIECSDFIGNMQGTGGLNVEGTADNALVRVEGVGGFDGYELLCLNMDVTVSGVGGAKVYASKVLKATLNGVGSIKYKGNPETKNLDTNGIGSIKKIAD